MTSAASPVQPRGERRRRELLEAVLRVTARDGLAGVSHRAVAAEAGVPLGATTYYFASKEEMVEQTLRHVADREVAALRERLAAIEAGRPSPEGWAAETVAWVEEQLAPDRLPALLARYQLQLVAVHHPAMREAYRAWTLAALEVAEGLLRAAGAPEPAADAAVLVAAVDGLQLNQLVLLDEATRARTVRRVVERLLARLAPPGRPL